METSANRSSINPSISSSYNRISGGTPIISVGNPGVSYKSKTQSALERYNAEKAVAEQSKKDAMIAQYGQAGYDMFMKVNQKRIEDIESGIKMSEQNNKKGITQNINQKLMDEQQRERDYRTRTRGLEGTLAANKPASYSLY